MAMISDPDYILQAIRLSALRTTDDNLTPRIISLDPGFSLNPYINAAGLSDVDRWPEIKRALDSPPPEHHFPAPRRRAHSGDELPRLGERNGSSNTNGGGGGGGLKYTQTIMGGKSGGLGMRVTGRIGGREKMREGRANSSSATSRGGRSSPDEPTPTSKGYKDRDDGFFAPIGRPRADSAPVPHLLEPDAGTSMITTGRGMGAAGKDGGVGGILETALSVSEHSGGIEEEEEYHEDNADVTESMRLGISAIASSNGAGMSARPHSLGIAAGDPSATLGEEMVDEGSDVDEDEIEEEGEFDDDTRELPNPLSTAHQSARFSIDGGLDALVFKPVPVLPRRSISGPSALTAALNKHVPHLVSTSSIDYSEETALSNPFASLYASVVALSNVPSIQLEIYFPHSRNPTTPLIVKVRKDATVEEVTGYGLYKYWEEGKTPLLQDEESEGRWSTVGWGLRIVEDDGEVDEDFPPLDRESQISKFSYGQFAIVEATESQARQNAVKAPHIQRRPSRIIAQPTRTRPSVADRPSFPPPVQAPAPAMAGNISSTSLSSSEHLGSNLGMGSSVMKGSVGLSSALSKTVLLRVRVTASADVHFTTTISVPSDMYIADLTEVLCKKKRLQSPASDWVLCLADLTLALPLDRTVASLEGRTDLALVRRQWAVEHGLRIGDRRGGDPSASIFKRISEPAPLAKFGAGVADISQTYKKYHVQRKIAIGRHERILAIDGEYIHIMPSESRAFFDSTKTTSFHITLVASCKLTGRAGGFKINVWRDGGQKRYEFEADNGRQAAEIITSIRQLMKSYQSDRSSVMPPPRPASSSRR